MNGYNFTDRVRKVLALSREIAERMRHEYVGTEHLLLGLIEDGEGVGSRVLQTRVDDVGALAERLQRALKPGAGPATDRVDLPFTSRAKKSLEFAMHSARDLKHSYVGTEHLLLGIIREKQNIAASVLTDSGLTFEVAVDEVQRLLGSSGEPGAQPPREL